MLRSSGSWGERVDALAVELHESEQAGVTAAFRAATVGFDHHSQNGELDIAWRES